MSVERIQRSAWAPRSRFFTLRERRAASMQAMAFSSTAIMRALDKIIARTRRRLKRDDKKADPALFSVHRAVLEARDQLDLGIPVAEVTYEFQQQVDAAARAVVEADLSEIRADLAEIGLSDHAEIDDGADHADNSKP